MTLHLHRGTDTTVLADGLAALLATPLPDPFAEEVVVVPAKGVERWLSQRLSHRLGAGPRGGDGVCAGVRFLNPRSLVAMLTGTQDDDPWDPDRFVWPLLEVIDDSLDEPWCAALARHLGHGSTDVLGELRRDRRYATARRLAGLLASYAVQRPRLVADWREGRDSDGVGGDLAGDLAWQPELWRRLLAARPDVPAPDERHAAVLADIRAGTPLDLPARLSMFGHTRLPRTELELLAAVGEVREVHLWLPQASPVAWDRLAAEVAAGPCPRRDDATGRRLRHRLLSSLGRDARELQRSLTLLTPAGDTVHTRAEDPDADTLLAHLQADLRADRSAVEVAALGRRPRRDDDTSLQVHACHSPARQVEVLREVLVGMLEDDPSLEPRDILVMCPDVEAFAPLFSATFGLLDSVGAAGHPGHQLRVRLADRGLGSTNPLLEVAVRLVELAGGRATASEVLDLAASDVVRQRFALDEDDVSELRAWAERSGVRWGLSPALRADFSMSGYPHNTWQAGLDRVLLGAAMAEGDVLVARRLPLDDVGSSGIELSGRLAELVDRLAATVGALRESRTLAQWGEVLLHGVVAVADVAPRDAWVRTELDRQLATMLDEGGSATTVLRLADVRRLLLQHTQPRPTRANFRTGELTVATLVPMRSVPHRVVCLVGLDDGVFPRNTVADGDDVLLRDPVTGERDPRGEDRQLLLDAVLAAGDALVVTYTGRSVHSNEERPPAVPLGELLDAAELTWPGARRDVLTGHRLQPFDPDAFGAGGAVTSFDRAGLEGARAVVGERSPRPSFLDSPLPEGSADVDAGTTGLAGAAGLDGTVVTLEAMQAFFTSPVKGFLRQGLGAGLPREHDAVEDRMPVELDNLERWALGDRILARAIAGQDPQSVFDAELTRGLLPPGALGDRQLEDVTHQVNGLYVASAADRAQEPTTVDVAVDLVVDGRPCRLTGVVPDVRGDCVVRVGFGSLSVKHRWRAWLDLLALAVAEPGRPWSSATYGWEKRASLAKVARLTDVEDAEAWLADLVSLYRQGLREPLPLPQRTALAFAEARRYDKNPFGAARGEWDSRDNSPVPGEGQAPEHVRVYGAGAPVGVLLTDALDRDAGPAAETTRLGRLACRMWNPVFAHEAVRKA